MLIVLFYNKKNKMYKTLEITIHYH